MSEAQVPTPTPHQSESVFGCLGTVYRSTYTGCEGWNSTKIGTVSVYGALPQLAKLKADKEAAYPPGPAFMRTTIKWGDPVALHDLSDIWKFLHGDVVTH